MGILKAVAFDLDGTLYPNYRLNRRLLPQVLRHPLFFKAFLGARRVLHAGNEDGGERGDESGAGFYDRQAAIMAAFLKKDAAATKQKIDRRIYRGWEAAFTGIKPFPFVSETLAAFRGVGLKLALLSDFPPRQKLVKLGLDGFFDAVLATEESGALKPSGIPFAALARELKLPPPAILYVGNSVRYDVDGAKAAGMKTALIRRGLLSTGRVHGDEESRADFVFKDYRQLREYVLGLGK